MGRPKGSINKPQVPNQNTIQRNDIDPETERQYNEIARVFAEGFIAKIYSDGMVKDVTMDQIQTYLANPDNYITEMQNLAMYYYICNAEVFQLFDLARVLPTLNHKINVLNKTKTYENNLKKCNKVLTKIKHKQLTRDLISQLISSGTVTGIWLGDESNPYLYTFDDIRYFYPNHRLFGNWVVRVDLSYLKTLTEDNREIFFQNLTPYITKANYEEYIKNTNFRYIDLPQDRSIALRTHTLKRSQQYGINWSVTGLFDLGHKKKLKDLEKAISNKIISAIAILTIGNKEDPEKTGNLKLNTALKKKIYTGVKSALEKNQNQGVTVIGIPEFADIKFPDMKSDALMPEKFTSINNDINTAYGLTGDTANFATKKADLDLFYKKLAVLLEDIEQEVYSKLFNIILPKSISEDYQLVYDKESPLTLKEKVDILMRLHNMEGFALKPIIDLLSGEEWTSYIEQSLYEQENMKLQERIKPYASAFTGGDKNNKGGAPTIVDPTNSSTGNGQGNGGNSLPEVTK